MGCGAHATAVHLRNARRAPGALVTAIADPDPRALARAGRLVPRAARLSDVGDLVQRDDVDAVVVATPPATHAELAVRTIEAGKHLYLEKPVGITRDEADLVARIVPRPGLVATVGFNRRFHPVVVEAAKIVDSELGRVVRVRTVFEEPLSGDALPAWKRARATGGGAPLDLGSHHVDLVHHLLGTPLTPVSAELASVASELDDCTLRFDGDGCDVEIRCSFVRGRGDVVELEDDSGHTLKLDRYACTLTLCGRTSRTRNLVISRALALARPLADRSYGPSLYAWIMRIRGRPTGSPATLADGLTSLEAILAAEELAAVARR